jgi:DNA-binding NtrC family response regulator
MGSVFDDSSIESRTPVTLLLASPLEEDHASLREMLMQSRWRLLETRACQEALALIKRHDVPVVICEQTLPDGDWRTLLEATIDMPERPRLIVSSRRADHHLWADVLSLGGYDVLTTPFDATEVFRVVFLAWYSSRRGQTRRGPASATAA